MQCTGGSVAIRRLCLRSILLVNPPILPSGGMKNPLPVVFSIHVRAAFQDGPGDIEEDEEDKIRNRGYFNQGTVILLLAAVCVFLRACIFDNFSLKTLITVIIAVIVAAGMIVLAMKGDGDDRRGE